MNRDARTSAIWAAGLVVAAAAAVATAHGLYEVVRAAGAPSFIAALYPAITDGLALVAYAATTRLYDAGRRYAWTIVVLAAGLSGLAQAAYTAGGVGRSPDWLRFGIGAWPATAAAIVAHLLYLLASNVERAAPDALDVAVQPYNEPSNPSYGAEAEPSAEPVAAALPRARARDAARAHRCEHGEFPTAAELMRIADVSRGTAGNALKDLRDERAPLKAVPRTEAGTDR